MISTTLSNPPITPTLTSGTSCRRLGPGIGNVNVCFGSGTAVPESRAITLHRAHSHHFRRFVTSLDALSAPGFHPSGKVSARLLDGYQAPSQSCLCEILSGKTLCTTASASHGRGRSKSPCGISSWSSRAFGPVCTRLQRGFDYVQRYSPRRQQFNVADYYSGCCLTTAISFKSFGAMFATVRSSDENPERAAPTKLPPRDSTPESRP